ncbi:MAG: hypothetical protein ACREQ4_16345 [Candidatus Binataceae bacterium]
MQETLQTGIDGKTRGLAVNTDTFVDSLLRYHAGVPPIAATKLRTTGSGTPPHYRQELEIKKLSGKLVGIVAQRGMIALFLR